ncbi:hypothetical protein GW17_00019136, partial [Ensete ventricosum]
ILIVRQRLTLRVRVLHRPTSYLNSASVPAKQPPAKQQRCAASAALLAAARH